MPLDSGVHRLGEIAIEHEQGLPERQGGRTEQSERDGAYQQGGGEDGQNALQRHIKSFSSESPE
jgi:hypothetical protein